MGHIGIVETPYGDISLKNTKWRETWSFFPRRCIFTQKWMNPFTKIMYGKKFVSTSFGLDPQGKIVYEYYWTTPKEFTLQKLKGNT